jgi:malic enzyme
MEGKALILKELADVDAIPLVIDEKDPEKLVDTIRKVSVQFSAINLEDIKAPDCFYVEDSLQDLGIPVFHDDQHGTAIATLAALLNALKEFPKKEPKIVINGAGAAGLAIFHILWNHGFRNIVVLDSKGALSPQRSDLDPYKREVAELTQAKIQTLKEALVGADIFIGVSKGNLLKKEDIEKQELSGDKHHDGQVARTQHMATGRTQKRQRLRSRSGRPAGRARVQDIWLGSGVEA